MATFPSAALTLALAQSGQQGGGVFGAIALPFIILMIFYVFLFVPQQRQRKRITQMQNELKAGDKVIMNCGIYGTVVGVEEETLQLRVAEQIKIRVSKQAIGSLQPEPKES